MLRLASAAALLALCLLGAAPASAAAVDGKKVTVCLDAADNAGKFPGACIGMIFADCSKAPNADSNACGAKELAFWQSQLASTLKDANAAIAGYPEMVKPQADAQKAWASFRDNACGIADKVDPGTMPGGTAYCKAEVTAERVIMLRRIVASLGEH